MSRLDMINNYGEAIQRKKENEQARQNASLLACRLYAESVADRINELIETASACEKNGINIGKFKADGFYHILGFYGMWDSKINSLALLGGGACGVYDTIIDAKGTVYSHSHNSTSTYYRIVDTPSSYYNLNGFGEQFEIFETKFYEYVDNIVNKTP